MNRHAPHNGKYHRPTIPAGLDSKERTLSNVTPDHVCGAVAVMWVIEDHRAAACSLRSWQQCRYCRRANAQCSSCATCSAGRRPRWPTCSMRQRPASPTRCTARATMEQPRAAGRLQSSRIVPTDEVEQSLVRRYVEAWQACDVGGLAGLLKHDVVLTMPPLPIRARPAEPSVACVARRLARTRSTNSGSGSQVRERGGGADLHPGWSQSAAACRGRGVLRAFMAARQATADGLVGRLFPARHHSAAPWRPWRRSPAR